jgi:hypothetical protein
MVLSARGPARRCSVQAGGKQPVQRKNQVVGPSVLRTRPTRCHAFKEPRVELSPEEVEEWDRCAATLVSMGVGGEEEADRILKESYGWCAPTSRVRYSPHFTRSCA